MVDSLLLALSFVVSLFFSFVFDFRVLRQFIVCDNVMVSEMVPEFLVALNRDLLPCLCLFHFHSHKLIIEGIKKKILHCPSFPGLYTAFKEREGQRQLVVEHVYSREMLNAKRLVRGLQRKSSARGDL